MTWFLLNIPLAALVFLAWTLIPLWLTFKHPDTGPGTPATAELAVHSDGTHRLPESVGHRPADVPTAA